MEKYLNIDNRKNSKEKNSSSTNVDVSLVQKAWLK